VHSSPASFGLISPWKLQAAKEKGPTWGPFSYVPDAINLEFLEKIAR
jgi:hypothetical protein